MPSFFAPSRVNDEAARYTLTIDSQGCSGSAKQHGGGKNPGCAFTSGGASREIQLASGEMAVICGPVLDRRVEVPL